MRIAIVLGLEGLPDWRVRRRRLLIVAVIALASAVVQLVPDGKPVRDIVLPAAAVIGLVTSIWAVLAWRLEGQAGREMINCPHDESC